MIIVVSKIKDSLGKVALAIIAATNGKDVLLVDADDQETSTDFMALGNEFLEQRLSVIELFEVVDQIMTLNQKQKHI